MEAGIPDSSSDSVDGPQAAIPAGNRDAVDEDTPSVLVASEADPGHPEAPESPCPSYSRVDDDAAGGKSSRDALARGISSLLCSVIKDFDLRAQETMKSQEDLSSSIDRLTQELDRLLEDAPLPFIMQHAARISSVRKRVTSMNTILRSIQRRVDNIDRILSVGSHSHPEKTPTEGS